MTLSIGQGGRPPLIKNQADLDHFVEKLLEIDKELISELVRIGGNPPLRLKPQGLESLINIVLSQQVSTASANAIFVRLIGAFPTCDPEALEAAPDSCLASLGLSRPKIRTVKALSNAINSSILDLEKLPELSTGDITQKLTSIKGIGRWSAELYLMFCLGEADVWPSGDLALQEATKRLMKLHERPNEKALNFIGERWRPYRAIAALLLWRYYTVLRDQPLTLLPTSS